MTTNYTSVKILFIIRLKNKKKLFLGMKTNNFILLGQKPKHAMIVETENIFIHLNISD
jgi:hypothetical protein